MCVHYNAASFYSFTCVFVYFVYILYINICTYRKKYLYIMYS